MDRYLRGAGLVLAMINLVMWYFEKDAARRVEHLVLVVLLTNF
jgi:hypothetical protein